MPELSTLIPIIIGVVIAIIVIVALFAMIKTANGNEALVVSGVGATDKNGNPTIKRAGGRVVIPFIQKAEVFRPLRPHRKGHRRYYQDYDWRSNSYRLGRRI